VLASTTYNTGVFPAMETYLHHLTERGYQNRTVAFIENGSWAPSAAKDMAKLLEGSKDLTILPTTVTIRSALNDQSRAALEQLCQELA
ncbi:MAG: FprA family A-type flavoprotein, partial [Oscillospiraceae bacterium]|nr:FprA family A-type flavoprotein [Oscillospiraceae bacterium]